MACFRLSLLTVLRAWLSLPYPLVQTITQRKLSDETLTQKEQTITDLQSELELKIKDNQDMVDKIASLIMALYRKDRQLDSLSLKLQDSENDNVTLRTNFLHLSTYSVLDWNDLPLIRLFFQDTFRQMANFIVRNPNGRHQVKIRSRLEQIMIVDLQGISMPHTFTAISCYRLLCKCIKAR